MNGKGDGSRRPEIRPAAKQALEHSGSIHIDLHVIGGGGDSGSQDARLAAIDAKLVALLTNVGELKMANSETNALLDQLNTYTNQLAASAATQAAKVQEISDDIDKLIAESSDPALQARLQAHADALATIAASEEAQSATLTAIAAKREDPLPPPVEPEPVE